MKMFGLPLGKIPDATAGAHSLKWHGLLKVLRLGLVTAGGAFLGYVITNIVNVDILPEVRLMRR
jgi:hypothetical protein